MSIASIQQKTQSRAEPPLRAIARVPATCGELVQGEIDKEFFLVNAPVKLYAEARVELGAAVNIVDPNYELSRSAMESVLRRHSFPRHRAKLSFSSRLPRGKGLASSTSEISAAVAASLVSLGVDADENNINGFVSALESNDGNFYSGISVFNAIRGYRIQKLPKPPKITVVIVDMGGVVETKDFDRIAASRHYARHSSEIKEALNLVREGLFYSCPKLIASGATLSAQVNQKLLPKKGFDLLLNFSKKNRSIGLCCAHTGSVVGVLFDESKEELRAERFRLQSFVGAQNIIATTELTTGGVQSCPL